jgi:hypothetical protein
MKSIYPKLVVVSMILIVAFMFNFKYHYEPAIPAAQPQQVKKVIIVKKVYIKVPVFKDSTHTDSSVITLPKETKTPDFKKYYRSRNIHKGAYIS